MAEKKYTIIQGDSAQELKHIADNTIDAVITDPPYGLAFLGKDWDSFKATKVAKSQVVKNLGTGMRMTTHDENKNYQEWCQQWGEQCLRILKPGGYLLAFSAARLYHRIATGLEDAGFEIRDQLMWIYSSGFPKAQDIGKMADSKILKGNADPRSQRQMALGDDYTQVGHYTIHAGDQASELAAASQHNNKGTNWQPRTELGRRWAGWKTQMKPAHEPIVMARKRFKGSTIDNIQQHGVGALNIDSSRIAYEDQRDLNTYINNIAGPLERSTASAGAGIGMHEGQTGFKVQKGRVKRPQAGNRTASFSFGNKDTESGGDGSPEFEANPKGRFPSNVLGDIPNYQKYFYCPKVSRRERHTGFDTKTAGNNHPTVKPVALMRYLIELVTPPNSHIVDPFTGSGTTGMAATELGHRFTGIEQDPAYVEIANKRIKGWSNKEQNKEHTEKHSTANKNTQITQYDRLFE